MRNRRMHALVLLLLLLAASLLLPAKRAQAEPSSADRETARSLVIEGRAKLAAGDHEGAHRALLAAHQLMGVPTTGLDLARAQEALGMLIEARSTALAVSRMPARAGEPEAFVAARPAAAELAERIAGRIPSLIVTLKGGASGASPSVTVDGTPMPLSLLALSLKVNPGAHQITASAPGYSTAKRDVVLGEGETKQVELTVTPQSSAPYPPASPSYRAPSSSPSMAPPPLAGPRADAKPNGSAPTWAWISGAAGLAALGAGAVFAVDYANVRSTVARDCPDTNCDPHRYTQASADALHDRWNRDLGLTLGLGAAGLGALGAAAVGLFGSSGEEKPPRAPAQAVTPWFSPGAAGASIRGVF